MRHAATKASCLVLFAMASALPAQAATVTDFTGAFDTSLWSAVTAAGGSIDLSQAPASIGLLGSDDGSGPASQDFTITAGSYGIVSLAWTYESLDLDPVWDQFGYLRNGMFHQISSDLDGLSQSGTASFNVALGDVFGFSLQSFDSSGGAATAWVSGYQFVETPPPPVPEPPAAMLMALGLLIASGRVLRARKQRVCTGAQREGV